MFTPLLTIRLYIQSIRPRSSGVLCPCLSRWRQEARQRGQALALAIVLSITLLLMAACVPSSTVSPLGPATTPAVGSSPSLVLLYSGEGLEFERISVEHGLSQSTVNCILQGALF